MKTRQIPDALWVYSGEDLVGTLYRTEPLSFAYSDSWITTPRQRPLHPYLPIGPGRIDSIYVHSFFENLLPEGNQRKLISAREHVSTVFGLLAAVGGESAGAYSLVPEGEVPLRPVYQKLTWEQVSLLVHADGRFSHERQQLDAAAANLPKARMSISGAQLKMLLYIDQGVPHRPMGASPSTHILKPDILRTDINLFASAANEALVMRAAHHLRLPVASVEYQPVAKACLVERYDRIHQVTDGTVKRLWQADLCQLAGRPSDVKYEIDGGPTFAECFELVGRLSSTPGVDQRHLLNWLFFNLYVGNNDAHAKNLSMLATNGDIRLAPFYDMMCTRVYPGLGPNMAMSISGEFAPGRIGSEHLQELAKTLGAAPKYVERIARQMASAIKPAFAAAAAAIGPMLSPSERVAVERVCHHVTHHARQMSKRLSGGALAQDEDETENLEQFNSDRPSGLSN